MQGTVLRDYVSGKTGEKRHVGDVVEISSASAECVARGWVSPIEAEPVKKPTARASSARKTATKSM